jgi:hypothetical protein
MMNRNELQESDSTTYQSFSPMTYTVEITETYYTTVSFETEEEAKEFMEEPNYDLVDSWELDTAKLKFLEGN